MHESKKMYKIGQKTNKIEQKRKLRTKDPREDAAIFTQKIRGEVKQPC